MKISALLQARNSLKLSKLRESKDKRDVLAAQQRLIELLDPDFDVAIGPKSALVITNPKLPGKVKTAPSDFLDLEGELQLELEASCVKWFAENFRLKVTADAVYSKDHGYVNDRWPRMVVTFESLDDALQGLLYYNNFNIKLDELVLAVSGFDDDEPLISDINSLEPA